MFNLIFLFFRAISKLNRTAALAIARHQGLKIGQRTLMVGNQSFGSEPYLVSIGEDCLITDGVKFITHDGAIQVPLIKAGEKIENVYSKKSTFGRVRIGNNVFIGVNSILLPETSIGDNSIVAAGSVVKGEFPEGVVLGGSPAKIICNVSDYFLKNESRIVSMHHCGDRGKFISTLDL